MKLVWEQTLAVDQALERLIVRYHDELKRRRLSPEATEVASARLALLETIQRLLEIHYAIEREVVEPGFDNVEDILAEAEALTFQITELLEDEARLSSEYSLKRLAKTKTINAVVMAPEGLLEPLPLAPAPVPVPVPVNKVVLYDQAQEEAARLGMPMAENPPYHHGLIWALGAIAAATMIASLEPAATWTVAPAGGICGAAAFAITWHAKRRRSRWIQKRIEQLAGEKERHLR